MDNQNISQSTPNIPVSPPVVAEQPQSGGNALMSRKTIFIILGIVVLAEIIWAGWSLLQSNQSTATPSSTVTKEPSATASLTADKNDLKVGETVTVILNISSESKSDGIDLIVNFDPKLLAVDATPSALPVQVGTMFKDYPQNRIDTPGKVVVSGITDLSGGVLSNGILGTINFKALAPGQTKISLDYKLGSTADSNVIETGSGKDILNEVNNIELKITP